ncbi:MAG: hypothetical protein KDA84_20940 [Planctomycetaceae bacterium]|nr:hypothetical protein [Planctomycetaceae bacterium]
MLWIFRKIAERIQTLLIADSAMGLEAEFLGRHAERKAQLLRKAQEYEEQGFEDLAEELRSQVHELSITKPLSSVLPALTHLDGDPAQSEPAKLDGPDSPNDHTANNGSKTKKTNKTARRKAR